MQWYCRSGTSTCCAVCYTTCVQHNEHFSLRLFYHTINTVHLHARRTALLPATLTAVTGSEDKSKTSNQNAFVLFLTNCHQKLFPPMAPFSEAVTVIRLHVSAFTESREECFIVVFFRKCTNLENGKEAEKVNNILVITQLFRPWRKLPNTSI